MKISSSSLPHWEHNISIGESNAHTTHTATVRRRISHDRYACTILHRPSWVAEREQRSVCDILGLPP